MKNTTLAFALILIASCTKENQTPAVSTMEQSLVASQTVTFDTAGTLTETNGHNVVSFEDLFKVSPDTGYIRELVFVIRRSSATMVLNKAVVYIDGIRMRTVSGIIGDTLRFRNVTPWMLDPAEGIWDNHTKHVMDLRLFGTGNAGDWYRPDLQSVLVIRSKNDRYTFSNLPQKGLTITF